jgi:ABC-type transport system involved in multi-copper enzyme maturation permease subunit
MTVQGILLVVQQEFRVRLRTGRWRWLLGAWVVAVLLFTLLLDLALADTQEPHGIPLFGGLMLFVLALVLVVSPAITAQSINGDRERGTLATLQVTRLTAADIALGKLLAGWGVGLVALGLTTPFVLWAIIEGGVTLVRAVVVLVVVALLIGVVCAISQALSALLARSITSALLSYVTVFALVIGTLIAFSFEVALVRDRPWWLLAPNPFVVLADATPQLPAERTPDGQLKSQPLDPLGGLGRGIRSIRRGYDETDVYGAERPEPPPVWPWGLGFDLLLGIGSVVVTTRRLRTPARRLAKGVRIA